MKSKEEILKMTKKELLDYKRSTALDKSERNSDCSDCSRCSRCSRCYGCSRCSDCSGCSGCSDCFGCFGCSDCFGCRNAKGLQYAICNVVVGKKAYEKKMKELKEKE